MGVVRIDVALCTKEAKNTGIKAIFVSDAVRIAREIGRVGCRRSVTCVLASVTTEGAHAITRAMLAGMCGPAVV